MLYNDSEVQRAEYQKVGQPYEETEEEKHYKQVLKQIESDPNKKERIIHMKRIMVSPGEEYIVYHHIWEGTNPIGSFIRTTQTNVGIYGHFEPIYERFIQDDNTFGQRLVSKNIATAYFIPFTKETAEELHKLCDDKSFRNKTEYVVQPEGGTPITINSYNDWVNGDFDDLHENGTITKPLPNNDSNKREMQKQH